MQKVIIDVPEEIEPYLLYCLDGNQVECAVWVLKDARKALALFLSGDAATSYRDAASLGPEWKIHRPAKNRLLQILRECQRAGILYAVLDPDFEKAKRIWNIQEVLSKDTRHGIYEVP